MSHPRSSKKDLVREFRRAANKRRAAATILFQHIPPHYTDAVYLAGYAAECELKALILSQLPIRSRSAFVDTEFRGRQGHDIPRLSELLKAAGVNWPREIHLAITRIASWSTDLRYMTQEWDAEDAADFLSALDKLIIWAEGRMS